jgi:hypothetical protein
LIYKKAGRRKWGEATFKETTAKNLGKVMNNIKP